MSEVCEECGGVRSVEECYPTEGDVCTVWCEGVCVEVLGGWRHLLG